MPHIVKLPFQVLIALDQFINTLTGGWADETLSARCWRLRDRGAGWKWARQGVDTLFFFDPDHCRTSYEAEQKRMHLPPGMRG